MKRDFRDESQLAEEHSAIRVVMRWIEADLDRQLESSNELRGDGPLLGPLVSLRDHLARHFAFEERSGVVAAALALQPDATVRLREWVAQHRDIMLRVEDAVRQLEAAAKTGASLPITFAEEIHDLFAALREHDLWENSMLGNMRASTFRSSQRVFERESG